MNRASLFYVWMFVYRLLQVGILYGAYSFVVFKSGAEQVPNLFYRLEFLQFYALEHIFYTILFFALLIALFMGLSYLDDTICLRLVGDELSSMVTFEDDDVYISDDEYEEND